MTDCLYIKTLNFDKKNLILLNKNFNVIKVNNINACPIKFIKKIKIIILPMDKFYNQKLLQKFISLKIIASPVTGDVHIDKIYIKKQKIKFINLKKNSKIMKSITATSDLVFAFIFELTRKILVSSNNFRFKKINFTNKYIAKNSIKDFTVGIIGLGRIGNHVASRAKSLGMKVYYYDPKVKSKKYLKVSNLTNLFKKSNIVTIHVHYIKTLKNLINLKFFKIQKKPSYFINTSRGEFLNEASLIYSLKKNILSGAALDVIQQSFNFSIQPNKNKLLQFYKNNPDENFLITPKIGGSISDARAITEKYLIDNLIKIESKL
ncbi:hypothetical protein N9U83_01240 [Candidatus Pelagibacter sp.]|nr:hypothetical protein [Candidatus Pelagibacter sp.]